MKKLKLYSRIECPLCEYAEELLQDAGVEYELVDIDDSDELIQRYHVKIPVIAGGVKELNWPFTVEAAQKLAKELSDG